MCIGTRMLWAGGCRNSLVERRTGPRGRLFALALSGWDRTASPPVRTRAGVSPRASGRHTASVKSAMPTSAFASATRGLVSPRGLGRGLAIPLDCSLSRTWPNNSEDGWTWRPPPRGLVRRYVHRGEPRAGPGLIIKGVDLCFSWVTRPRPLRPREWAGVREITRRGSPIDSGSPRAAFRGRWPRRIGEARGTTPPVLRPES